MTLPEQAEALAAFFKSAADRRAQSLSIHLHPRSEALGALTAGNEMRDEYADRLADLAEVVALIAKKG